MDVRDAIALRRNWPKWWAKMEIYAHLFDGPALVIDLDTVFVGELKIKPEHEFKAIFLRDPWRDGGRVPERLGGGFTYLPRWARERIWKAWSQDPQKIMEINCGDDQPFLHELFADKALRWQDHYIDEVVSYKAHVKSLGVSPDNKVIFYHGIPRPWDTSDSWIPKLDSLEREATFTGEQSI